MPAFASSTKRKERIDICRICEYGRKFRVGEAELYSCKKCHCSPLKPFFEASQCPLGKW
jgi:hypothetical protein